MGRRSILGLAIAASLCAQEPTFRTGISIVGIDAQVFDGNGIIDGLSRDDFTVTDDGQPVAIRYCTQEEQPLDLVFLLEISKMMAPNVAKLRGAAEEAIASLRQGDRAAAFSFSESVNMEMPLTSDLDQAKRTLRYGVAYARFAGKPFVLPAVWKAASYLAEAPAAHRRRAILMLGADAGTAVTQQNHMSLAQELWSAGVILSGVVIPSSWTRFLNDDNPYRIFGMISAGINRFDYVDDVAAQTGGETIYTDDAGPTKRTADPYFEIRRAIDRMRRRYALYYDMPAAKPGRRRRVSIELTTAARSAHPDAHVLGQRGYVVPKHGDSFGGANDERESLR